MRRINVKANTLASVPADAFVELLRNDRSSKESKPEYIPASALGAGGEVIAPGEGSGGSQYSSVEQVGDFKKTTLFVDLTGMSSSTTDLDIIGVLGASVAVNGDFATTAGWTLGTDWVITGGEAVIDGAQPAIDYLSNTDQYLIPGATYEVEFTVSTWVAGTVTPACGANAGTARGSAATFKERIVATDNSPLTFAASADFDGAIDNVTCNLVEPAFLFQVDPAVNGSLFYGFVKCLETPATGVTDIDFYEATEGTGLFDGDIASLTETVLLTKGGAWSADMATEVALTNLPDAGKYVYLTAGAAGTPGEYSAGQFLFEFWGV